MFDILASMNIALLPLSVIYVLCFARLQYNRRNELQSSPLSLFAWSMFCMAAGILASSTFFLLWDFDVITKGTQYRLSVLPRMFFIAGLILSFHALDLRWKTALSVAAITLAVSAFIAKVVL